MIIIWFEEAREDYIYWQSQDKKTVRRINQLLQDSVRNGYTGIGKPEPLKREFSGFWSERIDDANHDETESYFPCQALKYPYGSYATPFKYSPKCRCGTI